VFLNKYYTDDQINGEMGRTRESMADTENAYRVLIWKPEGNRSLGRHKRRWKDNMKMDLFL
jgi:hypothetical protein